MSSTISKLEKTLLQWDVKYHFKIEKKPAPMKFKLQLVHFKHLLLKLACTLMVPVLGCEANTIVCKAFMKKIYIMKN